MSRTMPTECPHGNVVDWGDFGPEDGPPAGPCAECVTEADRRFDAWGARLRAEGAAEERRKVVTWLLSDDGRWLAGGGCALYIERGDHDRAPASGPETADG